MFSAAAAGNSAKAGVEFPASLPGVVAVGATDERNPSMQAAGILSNITSSRADEVQNDDVEVPRNIAHKAEEYLKKTGIADVSYWGPEAEFFVFDSVRFDQNQYSGYYFIDSDEGIWNSGKEGANLGHRPRWKEGYFPVAPADQLQDFRSDVILRLMAAGVPVTVSFPAVPAVTFSPGIAPCRSLTVSATEP